MKDAPSYALDGAPVAREAFYAAACDPRRDVVVEACAGAGKTWMLVSRIVRALLDGTPAHEILAITFTRKAAGEMRQRLADELRAFSRMSPSQATQALAQRGMAPAEAAERASELIGLHERVLLAGRAVEVRTFHAWFSQLLHAAPLDLLADFGLAPGMTPIEDTSDLKPALMRGFQQGVLDDAAALAAYRLLSVRRGRHFLGKWLDAALDRRAEIELADAAGQLEASVPPAGDVHPATQVQAAAFVQAVRSLADALAARSKRLSDEAAQRLRAGLAQPDPRKALQGLRSALFTDGGEGTPRKQLGDLPAQTPMCAELDRIAHDAAQFEAHEEHAAMVLLSRRLFAHYAALKRQRALVDMSDLERVAFALLSDHALSGWVQQRLDARVRHLLIDEFQDTSPLQWHALHAWWSSYAGAGGGGQAPRLFIVGDPKQSIYRFRRAEPRVFEAAQRFVVEGLGGTRAACDHTRRCAPGVLAVVNAAFGALREEGALPQWREHTTEVAGDAAPSLWALPGAERPARAARDATPAERVWRPSLTVPRTPPERVLREAEAEAVAGAIEALVRGEGVAPQDILVLARKREPLRLAAEALAARHLPCVASEDLLLADLPEVQDLLAVLDVLASPVQDLALARALKSPLFAVGDEALLALSRRAAGRGGWWPALMAGADDERAGAALQRAARLFATWSRTAATLPPHDLLDRVVHDSDALARLAAAVPREARTRALEAVRALLEASLTLDGARFTTLYGFVRALRSRRVPSPRALQPDAVQLLTIHGAKGLEARIVFLMDTQPERRNADSATLLIDWPVEAKAPTRAAFVASEARCPASLQPLLDAENAAREREELNALYVALTRAEQRLVISRTPPLHAAPGRAWWQRLEALARPWTMVAPLSQASGEEEASLAALPLRPRAPAPSIVSPASKDDHAARLGQAVHRVLEWAARDGSADRAALASAAAREFAVVTDASAVLALASRILDSPQCRPFFDAAALAWAGSEVAVAAANGGVRRIDRLVQLRDAAQTWWVLDYKLAGKPEADPALREQLADYRRAVQALVAEQPVRAAFVTGQGTLVEPEA